MVFLVRSYRNLKGFYGGQMELFAHRKLVIQKESETKRKMLIIIIIIIIIIIKIIIIIIIYQKCTLFNTYY